MTVCLTPRECQCSKVIGRTLGERGYLGRFLLENGFAAEPRVPASLSSTAVADVPTQINVEDSSGSEITALKMKCWFGSVPNLLGIHKITSNCRKACNRNLKRAVHVGSQTRLGKYHKHVTETTVKQERQPLTSRVTRWEKQFGIYFKGKFQNPPLAWETGTNVKAFLYIEG